MFYLLLIPINTDPIYKNKQNPHQTQEFLKFIGPRGQKITRSANNVGPHVRQTFLNDVFTFLTEVRNAGHIVNTGTSSVNSEFVTALNM